VSEPAAILDAEDYAITPRELAARLHLSLSAFYHYQAAGRYERLELVPRIGPHRYSAKLVKAYVNREPTSRSWSTPRPTPFKRVER